MTRYALAVDPGGQHTGIVLAELADTGPVPVDGVTLERTEEERDTRHMGAPQYVRRVIEACLTMLEKHGVAEDAVQVFVETMLPPTPVKAGTSIVPMAIWRHQLGAWAVLGGVAIAWPDARLIAPAAADHQAEYPDVLKGRTPAGWTTGGSQRQHQRAAWAVLLSGLAQTQRRFGEAELAADQHEVCEQTRAEGTIPETAPVVTAPEPEVAPEAVPGAAPMGVAVPRLTPVQLVCERVTAGGVTSVTALFDAATQVWPVGTTSDRVALAVAAAMTLRPETDRDRMHDRLMDKAAELEGTPAES